MPRYMLKALAGLALFVGFSLPARAESVALKLTPWPPEGWPGDQPGVLRLVPHATRTPLLEVPITPKGWVIYDLSAASRPQPSQLQPLHEVLEQLLSTVFECPSAALAVSPAEARALHATFLVSQRGTEEPFAEVRLRTDAAASLATAGAQAALVYVDREAQAGGLVACGASRDNSVAIDSELHLPPGWSFIATSVKASLAGVTAELLVRRLPPASARLVRLAPPK